jgi:hypothetical protein
MKLSPLIESSLSLLSARNRQIADLALGGEEALVALAIVLIGAGHDHHKICSLVSGLMGATWAAEMDELLRVGDEKDNARPWEQHGSNYKLLRISSTD